MTEPFLIRAMREDDLAAASQLAAALVDMHHQIDPRRFMHLPNAAAGYAGYLRGELASRKVVLLVAERTSDHAIVGYAYGRLESRDYYELLEAHGKLHDVYVDEAARGHGLGEKLVREIIRELGARGAPRIVLMTAAQNEHAQKMFARLGFHTTMLEMTRERDG